MLPAKIVVATMNKKDIGTWYSIGILAMSNIDVSDLELGESVLYHLHQSEEQPISYEQINENWKALIKSQDLKLTRLLYKMRNV
jgi:hypothetical protein